MIFFEGSGLKVTTVRRRISGQGANHVLLCVQTQMLPNVYLRFFVPQTLQMNVWWWIKDVLKARCRHFNSDMYWSHPYLFDRRMFFWRTITLMCHYDPGVVWEFYSRYPQIRCGFLQVMLCLLGPGLFPSGGVCLYTPALISDWLVFSMGTDSCTLIGSELVRLWLRLRGCGRRYAWLTPWFWGSSLSRPATSMF